MKLSDYVIDYIVRQGTKHIFLVTGGAIAHIVDSAGKRKAEKGDLDYICVQHEQAGAMAAETYSRLSEGLGVMFATSGPGATNLIMGICDCWFDSVPALFISGQVNTAESVEAANAKPRQNGFQETDIVSIVKSITKFAEKVTDPNKIKYFLDKAVYMAKEGRPGPALLDLPLNIQIADIDPAELISFAPSLDDAASPIDTDDVILKKIGETIELIKNSQRPIILFGGGVKIAKAEKKALAVAEILGFPIVVSWSGIDILSHDHPQFIGHLGVYGSRGANLAVQNSDLLISLGSRLDTRQTGGRPDTFARAAKKVMVDIDSNEIQKGRGLTIDIGIVSDLGRFFNLLLPKLNDVKKTDISKWILKTKEWKNKYPAVLPEHSASATNINAYPFLKSLSDKLADNSIVVVDIGGDLVWTIQSFNVKTGQKLISTFGNGAMGYSLPAAIGASFALNKKPIICISGDGGFQLNIQELQTIKHYNLPIKIFIMNNRSMGIIKQFQDAYFNSNYYATTPEYGYSCPDFVKVANAYGIEAFAIKTPSEINAGIEKILSYSGPILCDVLIDTEQKLIPKLEFGRAIEDMSPYLDRQEFKDIMIIEPLPESSEIPKQDGWQTLNKY